MANKCNTRKRKNNKKAKKQLYKNIVISSLLCFLVLCLSYIIFMTDYLQPRVDEITTSYISFNNRYTTDVMKISNVKKMSDKNGSSNLNNKYIEFTVQGKNASKYEIVIYPIGKKIDNTYVNFVFETSNEKLINNLGSMPERKDGGRVIYQGEIKDNSKKKLRMWISKDYKDKANNTSFEIKIKSR